MNKIWTPEENSLIISSKAKGLTYQQITDLLPNRTLRAVSIQGYKLLGASISQTKWTVADEERLINLRAEGLNNAEIAKIMGRDFMKVKAKASRLIKVGRLESNSSPNRSHKRPCTHTEDELIASIKQYVTADACPSKLRYQVKKYFGNWSNGLVAAKLAPNCGGIMHAHKPTTIYLLDFEEFKKIGITQRTVNQRFTGAPKYTLLDTLSTSLEEANYFEQELKQIIKPLQFIPTDPWFERNGKTECFKGSYTNLVDFF